MKTGIIYRAAAGYFRYQGWPTVCRDDSGTLYTVWSGYRLGHVCPFGKNLMSVSRDGGESWSSPAIINDTYIDDRDAGICYLGNDNLIMSYFCHPKEFYLERAEGIINGADEYSRGVTAGMLESFSKLTDEMNKSGSFTRLSQDGGKSWGEANRSYVTSPHGPVKADGKLIWLGKEFRSGLTDKCGKILFTESTDCGKSWQVVSELQLPAGCTVDNVHEPDVAVLPDGRLVGSVRAQKLSTYPDFTMYMYYSEDGGKSWSEPHPTGISGSPPHLLVLSDGSLLCSYGRREAPFGVRAVISRDGGKSFGKEIILSEAESWDFGYPSTVELDGGALVTVYYQRCKGDKKASILYTKWSF